MQNLDDALSFMGYVLQMDITKAKDYFTSLQ